MDAPFVRLQCRPGEGLRGNRSDGVLASLPRAEPPATIVTDRIMDRGPEIWLRGLAHRYRKLEDAGHADGLLTVLFTRGGVALAGLVLLTFVQTYAVLVVAITLTLIATASVLLTILAMLENDGEPLRTPTDPR